MITYIEPMFAWKLINNSKLVIEKNENGIWKVSLLDQAGIIKLETTALTYVDKLLLGQLLD